MIHRVVIVEPSEIVQYGIKTALERCDQVEVVAVIDNAFRLNEKLAPLRANIVIINPTLIEYHSRSQISSTLLSGITTLAIVYTHIDKTIYDQFSGVIDIFDPISLIEEKINNAIISRKSTISDENTTKDQNELTEREKDILVAAVKGQTNKEISLLFNISIHTVISHRKNITRKTGIKSLSGLTVYTLLNNLTNPNEIK